MSVTIHIPEKIERKLRAELGGQLDRQAREALGVELYRQSRISIGQLSEMLQLGVIEAEAFLAQRGVPLNYTSQDLQKDADTLDRLLSDS